MTYDSHEHEGSIKIYLTEICKTPLLTPQQEAELAVRIKAGDSSARELMIKANLRLVVKIAHDYSGMGLPLLDLISEGNIGLMKAVERFDPNKGAKLSTYSSWWIKQAMKRGLANHGKTIRLPVHVIAQISEIRRARLDMAEQLRREPTNAEVAEKLQLPVARVVQSLTIGTQPASLDAPIANDDDGGEYGEIIPDEQAPTPAEALLDKTTIADMRQLLVNLNDREQQILTNRFGLNGGGQHTLDQVGAGLGITRERVRQLQNIALRKLRQMFEQRDKISSGPRLRRKFVRC